MRFLGAVNWLLDEVARFVFNLTAVLFIIWIIYDGKVSADIDVWAMLWIGIVCAWGALVHIVGLYDAAKKEDK